MALTTNQGLILPDGTDNANVPLTFTDFVTTAGSGVENRLVQRYLSIADRTARNPAPNEGEISYLNDLNVYQTYTGVTWANLVKGYVGDLLRTVDSVIDFVTFTAVAGTRYKLSWQGNIRASLVGDIGRILFRWQAGAVLTTAGANFNSVLFPVATSLAGAGQQFAPFASVTGIPAGTTSIGVSMVRSSGSGTFQSLGSAGAFNLTLVESI